MYDLRLCPVEILVVPEKPSTSDLGTLTSRAVARPKPPTKKAVAAAWTLPTPPKARADARYQVDVGEGKKWGATLN